MTHQETLTTEQKLLLGLSSTQLNIVTLIDVARTLQIGNLEGCTALMDNSPNSLHKGTAKLQTACRQGQTLNWLVYCMDMHERPDGTWPPLARIANIVFVNAEGIADSSKICADLKVYGAPDSVRSSFVPVYYYWAGTVMPDLKPGLYEYRLVIECETGYLNQKSYFDLNGPALNVVSMKTPSAFDAEKQQS